MGIDGFIDSTVEQTGTISDCYYGHAYYYAWYEFYPQPMYAVFNVHPGDAITAEVSYSSATGNFTTMIKDLTTHQSYTSPSTAFPGAARSSAEWISESAYFEGFLLLAHVSTVSFTNAKATIGGVTHTITGFAPNDYYLLMVDYNFGINQETNTATPNTETLTYAKGQPLPIGPGGGNFDFKWLSNGP